MKKPIKRNIKERRIKIEIAVGLIAYGDFICFEKLYGYKQIL